MEIKHRAHPTIPARGRKRFVIHHEKLYLAVHRYLTTRWFRYTVLFFIVGAIFSVICSSFEDGEYPNDEKALEKIIKGICFDNAKRYFAL